MIVHSNGIKLVGQTPNVDDDFETVAFPTLFTGTPIVFSQAETLNGSSSIVTRQKNIGGASGKIRVQDQEGDIGSHGNETVGVISIQ